MNERLKAALEMVGFIAFGIILIVALMLGAVAVEHLLEVMVSHLA